MVKSPFGIGVKAGKEEKKFCPPLCGSQQKKNLGVTIPIGWMIWSLQYAGFFFTVMISKESFFTNYVIVRVRTLKLSFFSILYNGASKLKSLLDSWYLKKKNWNKKNTQAGRTLIMVKYVQWEPHIYSILLSTIKKKHQLTPKEPWRSPTLFPSLNQSHQFPPIESCSTGMPN